MCFVPRWRFGLVIRAPFFSGIRLTQTGCVRTIPLEVLSEAFGDARGAAAEECEFVSAEFEAVRDELGQIARTPLDVEGSAAVFTVEMVVVYEIGRFVERGLARELDAGDVSLFDEHGERAVDGGEAHVRHVASAPLEHFLRAERAGGVCEDLADGGTLSGVSGWSPHTESWGVQQQCQPGVVGCGRACMAGGPRDSLD